MAPIGNKKWHQGEELACDFLRNNGYSILHQNIIFRGGEIDIVAEKEGITVFVEVKYRTNTSFGSPEESLTSQKRARLSVAIFSFCEQYNLAESNIRFDLIAIEQKNGLFEIRHYPSLALE